MGTLYNFFSGGGKKTEPATPPPRSLLTEGRTTLGAFQQLLPEQEKLSGAATDTTAGLLSQYGPKLTSAIRGLSPGSQAIGDELDRQAAEELAAGSSLTPSMQREIQQYVRSGQASRGFGFGPSDLTEEVFSLGSTGEALKSQRRSFAQSVFQEDQPANAAALQTVLGFAPQPQQYNAFNPYAEDLYNTNFNAAWTDKISTRNYNAAIQAALIGAIGQLDSSIVSGASKAAACWVAREVFGHGNWLWIMFHNWLVEDAPWWFRWLYTRFGYDVAQWIHDKPKLKRLIRRWMEGRIRSRVEQSIDRKYG